MANTLSNGSLSTDLELPFTPFGEETYAPEGLYNQENEPTPARTELLHRQIGLNDILGEESVRISRLRKTTAGGFIGMVAGLTVTEIGQDLSNLEHFAVETVGFSLFMGGNLLALLGYLTKDIVKSKITKTKAALETVQADLDNRGNL